MKWLLLILSMNLAFAQIVLTDDPEEDLQGIRSGRVCTEMLTEEPPFFISSAYKQYDKTYENLRSNVDRTKQSFIPRKSIVKVPKESQKYVDAPGTYVPVEVIGINDDQFHNDNLDKKGRIKYASNLRAGLPKVKLGEKGLLYSKSLERVDDYTFVVQEDSPLIKMNGLEGMNVVAIKPARREQGEFKTNRCCYNKLIFESYIKLAFPEEKECSDEYVFELIFADGSKGKMVNVDVANCNITNNLMPIKSNDFMALANFMNTAKEDEKLSFETGKLEFLDERGIVKIPMDYETYDPETRSYLGPYGSFHYNADDKGNSDIYAKPLTACAFMEILKTQQKECSGYGCQIQFGNIYHPKNWGPHSTHYSGECIDIRPLRIDNTTYSITHWNPVYNEKKTIELIKMLKRAGATNIYFNDKEVRQALPYVGWVTGHDNHIHFCLDPENDEVQKTCKDGVPPKQEVNQQSE